MERSQGSQIIKEWPQESQEAARLVIDTRVPADKVTARAQFDGSVVANRPAGEVSARCHDEQANLLALNLMHEIVSGRKSVGEARAYYAQEFLNYRRKEPTPYMEKLHFQPGRDTADPDQRLLSDQDLEQAVEPGKK